MGPADFLGIWLGYNLLSESFILPACSCLVCLIREGAGFVGVFCCSSPHWYFLESASSLLNLHMKEKPQDSLMCLI